MFELGADFQAEEIEAFQNSLFRIFFFFAE